MKIMIAGDLHCGSIMGLTPSQWQSKRTPVGVAQVWDWYEKTVNKIKPRIAIWNGDLIDGPGKKGAIDHITTNLAEQRDMAIEVIETAGALKNIFTFGTRFHVEDGEDQETLIANHFGGDIQAEQLLEIEGVRMAFRHHTGKTSIPHGQGTLIAKQLLWTVVHDLQHSDKAADIVFRSHVHEYVDIMCGIGHAITIPALQASGCRYGRRYFGYYHVGVLEMDIHRGNYNINPYICDIINPRNYRKVM